ncbi:hypothetical protein GCM10022295_47600 [Streptomyces osmaniensis]|uniref:Uncharacterized protein n=1 Tax=Streptomyces osmaniensis TaxID=593134 RepID=A0ABP6X3Q9_9ACTN
MPVGSIVIPFRAGLAPPTLRFGSSSGVDRRSTGSRSAFEGGQARSSNIRRPAR